METYNTVETLAAPKNRYGDTFREKFKTMTKLTKDVGNSAWASPILLSLLLGYNVYYNQTSNARIEKLEKVSSEREEKVDLQLQKQHDLLVELHTLKGVDERAKLSEKDEKLRQQELDRVYREKMSKEMEILKLQVASAVREIKSVNNHSNNTQPQQ